MRRRPFLATTLTAGAGFLAGCTGSSGGDGDPTTTPPAEPDGCPTVDDQVGTTVCTPDLADPDAEMAMQPPGATGSLPRADIEFSLQNSRDTIYNTNFYAWRLHKFVAGDWYYIAPRFWPEPLMRMEPGATHSWQLTVDNSDLARSIPPVQGTSALTVAGLGGGPYGFGVAGWFEGDTHESKTAFVTRFDLEGDQLSLRPTPDVEERVRDGDKVLVSWPQDEGNPVTYRVTRLKSVPDDADPVIAEQVIRDDPLRNALSLFERWSRIVELDTTTAAFETGVPDTDRTIVYRGTGYRIEVA